MPTSLPQNGSTTYDPNALQPKLLIKNYDFTNQYIYEAKGVKSKLPLTTIDFNGNLIDKSGICNGTALPLRTPYTTIDFDNDVKDNIGTNDGTIGGNPVYGRNDTHKYITFDGVGDRITLANENNFDWTTTSPHSYSFWAFLVTTPAASQVLYSKRAGASQGVVIYYYDVGQSMAFALHDGTTQFQASSTCTTGWHHIVCVFNGNDNQNGMLVYVDKVAGSVPASVAMDTTFANASTPTIGEDFTSTSPVLNGTKISQFQFWNVALTQGDVNNLYRKDQVSIYPTTTSVDTSTAKTHYYMDYYGYNYTTLANPTKMAFNYNNAFSVSGWLKTSTAGTTMVVVSKQLDTGVTTNGWRITKSAANAINFVICDGTNQYSATSTSTTLSNGSWHHFVGTYSGTSSATGVKIYLDSVNEASGTSVGMVTFTESNVPTIGATGALGSFLTGSLSQLQVWGHELTQAQVTELFAGDKLSVTSLTNETTSGFDLQSWDLHLGAGDDFGTLTFTLDDRDNILLDTTNDLTPFIKRQSPVELWLGKNSTGMQRWFNGKVFETKVLRPRTNLQQLQVTCVGWGSLLKERRTNITRNQKHLGSSLTKLDEGDNSVLISQILKDMINLTTTQTNTSLPVLDSIYTDNIDDTSLNIRLPNVGEQASTYATFISRLVDLASAYWCVDADNILFIGDPQNRNSGFLFTNDLTSSTTTNWDMKKLGIISTGNVLSWSDSSSDSLYSHIIGSGAWRQTIKDNIVLTSNTAIAFGNGTVGFNLYDRFAIDSDNVSKYAFKAYKTPTSISPTYFTTNNISAVCAIVGTVGGLSGSKVLNVTAVIAGQNISSLTLGGVEILGQTITYSVADHTDLAGFTDAIVKTINQYRTTPKWKATRSGTAVTVSSLAKGSDMNGLATGITTTATAAWVAGTTAGGVDPTVNVNDERWRGRVTSEQCDSLPISSDTSKGWIEIPVEPHAQIIPGETLCFIVEHLHSSDYGTSGSVNWNYYSTTPIGIWFKETAPSDGKGHIMQAGQLLRRIWAADRVRIIIENSDLNQSLPDPREIIIYINGNIEEETARLLLTQAADVMTKEIRTYDDIVVLPPDVRINTCTYCKVVDAKTGLNITAIITSVNLSSSTATSNMGCDKVKLGLQAIL